MTLIPYLIASLLVLLIAVLVFGGRPRPIDLEFFVEAIRQTENTPRGWVGSCGERSEWQLTGAVWETYSKESFELASSSKAECVYEQHRVAMAHARWVVRQLGNLGQREDVYEAAKLWCAGYGAVARGEITPGQHAYADRVAEIYSEMENNFTP